jgi:succinoglycan biosynthesis transport protein ExoP
MLQIDKSPPVADRSAATPELASPTELYASLIALLRRQFPVIIFVLLITMALGAVYLFTTPPMFTGQAAMIIDTRKVQLFQQQSILGDIGVDSATVESQVEILKSENIALSVIKDLRLAEDPEFIGAGGGMVGALVGVVSDLFGSSAEPKSEFELTRRALSVFQNRLTVRRVGLTYVINIGYQSPHPERAAQIANAVADAYVVDALEAKYQTTRRAAVWLQDRLKELRGQASTAERAVVDFKSRNNIVDTGGRLLNEQQLAELNSALIQARAQTAETQARLERVNEIMRGETANATVGDTGRFAATATVADTLRSEVITKLRSQYLDLANREADWSSRYGRNHLAAVNLRNQMREIARSIVDELHRIAETYKSDYEIAKTREESVQKSLSELVTESQTTSQAQIALRELESTSQTYRALYDNFLQRYMESVQQQSFPITEARLITQASRPLRKSYPSTFVVMAVTSAGGLILGFGIAMLRNISDRVFRTGSQVEGVLQTDCIAVLPIVKVGGPKANLSPRNTGDAPSGPRTIARDNSLLWHVIDSPFSRFAESIRSIKVAADVSGVAKPNKVIAITSALPNEGKSTIATALAQLMAHAGARVVLVDCDLRNPSLSRKLARSASVGLLEVISGKASVEEVVWLDPSTKLAFLPAVLKSRLPHTAEILASDATKKLFDKLRESYDYVVIDLSPLSPVVDVRAATHLMDSFVFVIEWGRTKIEMVEHALGAARGVYENLLGVALNKADINVLNRYESYRGNYYYNRYYSRYGYTE